MKSENYVTVQGWMRTELDLKGNDLIVYAVIYGYSQTENQRFTGSLQYLADWCGATKQGILKNLKNLLDRGLIGKEEKLVNNVKVVEYYSTQFNTPIQLSLINNKEDIKEENKTNTIVLVEKKPKSSKPNLYQKCFSAIEEFTDDIEVRDCLDNYLRFRLEIKDKPLYANQFRGILNKLRELTESKTEALQIIQQSIDKGYLSFYPIARSTYSNVKSAACEANVSCATMSEEEQEAQSRFIEQMREAGKQVEF